MVRELWMRRINDFLCLLLVSAVSHTAWAQTGDMLDRKKLTMTFSDEFSKFSWFAEGDVPKIGGGTWRTNFGYTWIPNSDVKNHTLVWNGEEQIYVDPGFVGSTSKALKLSPFTIKNGILEITAAPTNRSVDLFGYKYTSGLITTEPTFTQTYGVFEIRAKLPKGKGIWPAFWLLPADKTWPPEIDVLEVLGHEPTKLYNTLHYNVNGVKQMSDIPPTTIPDSSAAFHTYAVEWSPQYVVFYFDDKEIARRPTPAEMNKPHYMLANLAVGGSWPGSPDANTKFPAVYQIDYIRAYQRVAPTANYGQTRPLYSAVTNNVEPAAATAQKSPTHSRK